MKKDHGTGSLESVIPPSGKFSLSAGRSGRPRYSEVKGSPWWLSGKEKKLSKRLKRS